MPAGAGGHVDPRRPLHLHELALDLALEVVAALLVDEVPLVERDDQRPALLESGVGDSQILRLEPQRRVEQEHDDLGEIHRPARVGDGELLKLVLDLGALAHAGGVDQADRPLAAIGDRVRLEPPGRAPVLAEIAAFRGGRAEAIAMGPLAGLTDNGYKLVYTEEPNEVLKAGEKSSKTASFAWSLGMTVASDGAVRSVIWDSPAFNARLARPP